MTGNPHPAPAPGLTPERPVCTTEFSSPLWFPFSPAWPFVVWLDLNSSGPSAFSALVSGPIVLWPGRKSPLKAQPLREEEGMAVEPSLGSDGAGGSAAAEPGLFSACRRWSPRGWAGSSSRPLCDGGGDQGFCGIPPCALGLVRCAETVCRVRGEPDAPHTAPASGDSKNGSWVGAWHSPRGALRLLGSIGARVAAEATCPQAISEGCLSVP